MTVLQRPCQPVRLYGALHIHTSHIHTRGRHPKRLNSLLEVRLLLYIAFAGCIEKLFAFDVISGETNIAAGHLEEPSDYVSEVRICEHEASTPYGRATLHWFVRSCAEISPVSAEQSCSDPALQIVVSSTVGSNH